MTLKQKTSAFGTLGFLLSALTNTMDFWSAQKTTFVSRTIIWTFLPSLVEIGKSSLRKDKQLQLRPSKTRYDYNLTIMKSSKPAIDTIYPHIKFWWYCTMLNFYPPFLCRVLAAILKMADILKILKTQNCSSNGDLSLCKILCLYHYPVRSYQH